MRHDEQQPQSPITPGRAVMAVGCGHAAWGLAAYHDELRDLARSGVASVGDGVFDRHEARGPRAAAFWFMAAAPLITLVGHQLDRAERSGDGRSLVVAGWSMAGIGAVGATVMPRSGFWGVLPIAGWLVRTGRRLSARPPGVAPS